VARVDLALHPRRHVADTVEIGDRGAAEFHHNAGHSSVVSCQRSVVRHTYWGGAGGATMGGAIVSRLEVARFNALAGRWWDPDGPMRPLHRMNPARLGWIEEHVA